MARVACHAPIPLQGEPNESIISRISSTGNLNIVTTPKTDTDLPIRVLTPHPFPSIFWIFHNPANDTMRLLDARNGMQLTTFMGTEIPRYAILSHTWEDEEVTFQQMADPKSALKRGYVKIRQTCSLAAQEGLSFAWVDTCCIDKSSSAELSEAINSMFYWYSQAAVCYVYLSDLAPGTDLQSALGACRWFSRGWTLQELIAPKKVLFYNRDWQLIGTKKELGSLLSSITTIPESLLQHASVLSDYAIARRMSWAARRQTTRIEDTAYCLLGIFDVHMSPRYGEREKAFSRLQQAIIRQPTAELSLFAWTNTDDPTNPDITGILATSPRQFQGCTLLQVEPGDSIYRDFTITTRGIRVDASILQTKNSNPIRRVVLFLASRINGMLVGICLRRISGNVFGRYYSSFLIPIRSPSGAYYFHTRVQPVLLTTELPTRYPFHLTDPVLGNRHSALQVRYSLAQGIRSRINLGARRPYIVFPGSHWDSHDEVFFGTNTTSWGWCAFFFRAASPSSRRTTAKRSPLRQEQVGSEDEFFAACFHWNVGTERTLIAPLRSVDPAVMVALETGLGNLKYESATQAEGVIRRLLKDHLDEEMTTVDMPLDEGPETERC
ncbi:hypothetical protein OQA88_10945 [Cercophora sp. LCS_1]